MLINESLAVHDEQLVDDIPVEKLLIHDVPVDIICTPTQIIYTNTGIPKPQGLLTLHSLHFRSVAGSSSDRLPHKPLQTRNKRGLYFA